MKTLKFLKKRLGYYDLEKTLTRAATEVGLVPEVKYKRDRKGQYVHTEVRLKGGIVPMMKAVIHKDTGPTNIVDIVHGISSFQFARNNTVRKYSIAVNDNT